MLLFYLFIYFFSFKIISLFFINLFITLLEKDFIIIFIKL